MAPVPETSAMRTAMQTPELLELVLRRVDMATLLTSAQRVSRSWHRAIAESTAIQRVLFFVPEDSTGNDSSVRKNPLLAKYFPGWFSGHGALLPSMQGYASQPFSAPNKFDVFMFADATWRNMLVWQGSSSGAAASAAVEAAQGALGVWRTIRSHNDGSLYAVSTLYMPTSDEPGFTMGRYYDLAVSFVLEESQAAVYWPEDYGAFLAVSDIPGASDDESDGNDESLGGPETDSSVQQTTRPVASRDFRFQRHRLVAQASLIWALTKSDGSQKARDYDAIQDFSEKFMHDKHIGKGPSSSNRQLWSGIKQNAFPVEPIDWSMMRD